MRIERHFTVKGQDVFAVLTYRNITIEICHEEPERRLCIPQFEVPANWSDKAARHLAHHYVRRTGVPSVTTRIAEEGMPEWLRRSKATQEAEFGPETSLRQMVHRLVGAWTYWGWTHGYFDTEEDARTFYDEHAYLILMQRAMPASPQWHHTGLHWAYGLTGAGQGSYYVDAESGELRQADNAFERPQHHHYFIQGVNDDLSGEGGISDLWQREMRVFKHGSGSGCNMSSIRGANETLSNGMRPAGLVPFMEIGDKAAQTLTRTEASADTPSKLSLVDCDHPDVMHLLRRRLARHREQVAKAIGASKQRLYYQWIYHAIQDCDDETIDRYDPEQNRELGSVLTVLRARQVSEHLLMQYVQELRACEGEFRRFSECLLPGESPSPEQLSHIGFCLSNNFMRAVAHQQDWALTRRTDGLYTGTFRAADMLDEMAHYNWITGQGLIHFSDNIQSWHGCKAQSPIRASSPGGEFLFIDNSACDVAIINLADCLKDDGEFDIAGFEHMARLQTIMCDIAITMAQFPSAEIAYNSYRFRPIGLSLCNLAALLMAMGYAYDSAEGRATAAAIAALMTGKGYVTSAEIARELGGFEAFPEMRDGMMQLMWQHHEAAFGRTQHLGTADICPTVIDHSVLPDGELGDAVQRVWDLALIQGDEFGYSNAQISLVATSPNIVLLMDALAPGISPLANLDAGNEASRKMLAKGLARLDYTPEQIRAITAYVFGRKAGLNAPGINSEALLGRGFTETELLLIEEALERGLDVHAAFDPLHLGERFCRETLQLSDAQLYDADFKLLYHLGFDEEMVERFEQYLAGRGTVKGAPYLRNEDYAIFALADPASDQPISVEAQIQMAAAIQPYISGGIACPIVTPANTSVRRHRNWMMMAWQIGLKQLELRRAELSTSRTPSTESLNALRSAGSFISLEAAALPKGLLHTHKLAIERSVIAGMCWFSQPEHTAKGETVSTDLNVPRQRVLPSRRSGYVQEAEIGGVRVRHRTEEYADGSPGIVSVELPDLEMNLQQAIVQQAQMLSIALQYGVPLSAFNSVAGSVDYSPQGLVAGHAHITLAQSVLDYLMQDLSVTYEMSDAAETTAHTGMQSVHDFLRLHEKRLDEETESNSEPLAENKLSVPILSSS